MAKKFLKINEGLLVGILIYCAFVSILYLRMKSAEKLLVDYSVARLCILASNCREIIDAEILDYGSRKISFTNYGSRGLPLESGSFEEYLFTISIINSETSIVKVLPNTPSNINRFDVKNIYIPTKADDNFLKGNLFDGKDVFVEIWRDDVTFILIASSTESPIQTNEPSGSTISIGPSLSPVYERILPTENHPVIITEARRNDFIGWTSFLFIILSVSIFSLVGRGVRQAIDWINRKWRKGKNQTDFGLLSELTGLMASN